MAKIITLGVLIFVLTACAPSPSAQAITHVDLNNLQPLPTISEDEIQPFKVAIAAVISPKSSAESYAPLLDYLSRELGRPIERVQRRTYAEMNELVRTGEVDMAFVCTSSYIIGKREFGMQLLVAPQVQGETVYHAQFIVPSDSPFEKLSDLRGKVFAFTDPISFSGRMYPTYLLQQMGESPKSFFARTFFTYSHDDAINAVANGMADGASVDSLVLDFALKQNPALASQLRIIYTSPPFGIPPVVVGPDIRPQLRAQLTDILLKMHLNPEGQAALDALETDKFVMISDEDYRTAYEVESAYRLFETSEP